VTRHRSTVNGGLQENQRAQGRHIAVTPPQRERHLSYGGSGSTPRPEARSGGERNGPRLFAGSPRHRGWQAFTLGRYDACTSRDSRVREDGGRVDLAELRAPVEHGTRFVTCRMRSHGDPGSTSRPAAVEFAHADMLLAKNVEAGRLMPASRVGTATDQLAAHEHADWQKSCTFISTCAELSASTRVHGQLEPERIEMVRTAMS